MIIARTQLTRNFAKHCDIKQPGLRIDSEAKT